MICFYPHVPDISGPLKTPHPSIFLLGSEDLGDVWQIRAARKIEPKIACVFSAYPHVEKLDRHLYLEWLFYWLEEVDCILFWLQSPKDYRQPFTWPSFELGVVAERKKPLIVGVEKKNGDLAENLAALLSIFKWNGIIHRELEEAINEVENTIRFLRR